MKIMKQLSLLALSALSASAMAVQCPAVGEEYSNMIAKLDAIKASVKEGANCANVTLKVKSLEDLLIKDREEILKILESSRTTPLTKEQSELVEKYSEAVTTKVTSLYDLFTGSNKCFRDDESGEAISNLASFVGEASRLAANFTGPWGTPISLAGQVVAGFLTGLDKVMKSRAGYDFSKPEDWKNYVQNLCTFHSYQEQVAHLLDPQGRLKQLNDMKTRLDHQLELLASRCSDCAKIQSDVLSQGAPAADDVARADQGQAKPYGTYTLYALGIRAWVLKEIARVEKESRSYWADVSGRHLLSSARTSLRQFLVDRESPRFIEYQSGRTFQDFGAVENFALREGRALYYDIYNLNRKAVTDVGYYFARPFDIWNALLKNPVRWDLLPQDRVRDLQYSWVQFRDNGVTILRDSEASLEVVQGFCGFFREEGYYTSRIRQVCTGAGLGKLADRMLQMDRDLKKAGIEHQSFINPTAFDPNVAPLGEGKTSLDTLSTVIDQLN